MDPANHELQYLNSVSTLLFCYEMCFFPLNPLIGIYKVQLVQRGNKVFCRAPYCSWRIIKAYMSVCLFQVAVF